MKYTVQISRGRLFGSDFQYYTKIEYAKNNQFYQELKRFMADDAFVIDHEYESMFVMYCQNLNWLPHMKLAESWLYEQNIVIATSEKEPNVDY